MSEVQRPYWEDRAKRAERELAAARARIEQLTQDLDAARWAKRVWAEQSSAIRAEAERLRELLKDPGQDCPNPGCHNAGWYFDSKPGRVIASEPAAMQCEWCWTTPDSRFNRARGRTPEPRG